MSFVASCTSNEPTLSSNHFILQAHVLELPSWQMGRQRRGAETQWGRGDAKGNNLRNYVFKIFKSKRKANFGTYNSEKMG